MLIFVSLYFQTDKSGRTALHWAAIGGFAETCTWLLNNGANLFAKTSNDMNSLHAAVEAGKVEVIKALYAFCGADEDKKKKLANETYEGKTAWDIATISKNTPVCEALNEAGDENAKSAACVIS